MSEYIVQHDTMVRIADAVRTLMGTEETLSPDQIATSVTEDNTEVDTQADLIAQISAALDGKAGGGSGGAVETCIVTLNYDGPPIANSQGKIGYIDETQTPRETLFTWGDSYTIIKGSKIHLYGDSWSYPVSSGTNYTLVISNNSNDAIYLITGDAVFTLA